MRVLVTIRAALSGRIWFPSLKVVALAPEDESVLELKREAEHIPVKNLKRKDKIPIEDIQLFFGISEEIPGINKGC